MDYLRYASCGAEGLKCLDLRPLVPTDEEQSEVGDVLERLVSTG